MSLKNNKVRDVLTEAKSMLKNAGIDTFGIDAELLLMEVLKFSKIQLFTKDNYELRDAEINAYRELLDKRMGDMPVQYILGRCEFMGMEYHVNEYTLIPRADTEVLVEKAIEEINKNRYRTILDIGTGSGAIAVAIGKYCDVETEAVDISDGALQTAMKNAELNNVKVKFIKSDLFQNIDKRYDVIVSNPPYIKIDVISTLDKQVKDYEPITALDGGVDGLDYYRKIISESDKYINNGGMLLFEIGYDQGEDVTNLMMEKGYKDVSVLKDLAGLDRVVYGWW